MKNFLFHFQRKEITTIPKKFFCPFSEKTSFYIYRRLENGNIFLESRTLTISCYLGVRVRRCPKHAEETPRGISDFLDPSVSGLSTSLG